VRLLAGVAAVVHRLVRRSEPDATTGRRRLAREGAAAGPPGRGTVGARRVGVTRLRRLGAFLLDAARVLRWGEEAPGFTLVKRAWRDGALGRLGLLALVTLSIALGLVIASLDPAGAGTLPPAAVALALGALGLGTALGLAAAVTLPLSLLVPTLLVVGWYELLPAGGVAGTPLFALPPLVSYFLAHLAARRQAGRHARAWLLPMALAVGWASHASLGVTAPGEPPLDVALGLGLGLGLWAATVHRRALASRRSLLSVEATFALLFVALGATWLVAWARDPSGSAERLVLLGSALLLPLDLFWLWLGATTFQGTLEVGAWSARVLGRVVGRRVAAVGLPLVWLLASALAWLATWSVPLWAAILAHELGLSAWVTTWGDGVHLAVWLVPVTSVVALLLVSALALRRRAFAEAVERVHGLWIAAFLGVLALWEAASDAASAPDDAAQRLSTGAAVVLVGGLVWEAAKSGGDWAQGTRARTHAVLAGLLSAGSPGSAGWRPAS